MSMTDDNTGLDAIVIGQEWYHAYVEAQGPHDSAGIVRAILQGVEEAGLLTDARCKRELEVANEIIEQLDKDYADLQHKYNELVRAPQGYGMRRVPPRSRSLVNRVRKLLP